MVTLGEQTAAWGRKQKGDLSDYNYNAIYNNPEFTFHKISTRVMLPTINNSMMSRVIHVITASSTKIFHSVLRQFSMGSIWI